MLLRSVIIGTVMLWRTFLPASAAIPVEKYDAHLNRLLPPDTLTDILKEYLVRFLPGDCVGGMSYPYFEGRPDTVLLTTLQEHLKVGTIITLTEDAIPEEITRLYPGITFIHEPVIETVPFSPINPLKTILIHALKSAEEKRLVVHCFQGRGRTGTMLAAVLYLTTGYDMDDVISYIRATRRGAIDFAYQEVFLTTLATTIESRSEETRIERFFAAITDGTLK